MSKISRIARRPPIRGTGIGLKPKKRGFFDIWSRNESDSFRKELVTIITGKEEYISSPSPSTDACASGAVLGVNFFPDPDYAVDSLSLLDLPLIQARALFSKDSDLRTSVDREAVAFQAFQESEQSCKQVNDAFRDGSVWKNPDVARVLEYARQKIRSILGECPRLLELDLSFGPGASVTCRKNTSARWKLSTPPSVSGSILKYPVKGLSNLAPGWFSAHNNELRIVCGELEFVPKNYKTHRSIVIEPSLTGALQRSVGSHLKRKLYQAGIDLTTQKINRDRARQGSLMGNLATLDLSRASDSISYELVEFLLPREWFELLDFLRTPTVRYKAQVIDLEKFSSMGNGYTFELESLLFYSVIHAISRIRAIDFDCTIYGDDIIVNTALVQPILEIFPSIGFTVNKEKSFWTGCFRESCGFDAFLGVDVRPFYLKDRFSFHKVVCFYNFLMRKNIFDPDRKIRDLLLSRLPSRYQLYGPDGYGDGHLVVDDPLATLKPHRRDDGYSGFTFRTFVSIPYKDETPVLGDSILPPYLISLRSEIDSDFLGSLSTIGSSSSMYVLRFPKRYRIKDKQSRVYVLGVS